MNENTKRSSGSQRREFISITELQGAGKFRQTGEISRSLMGFAVASKGRHFLGVVERSCGPVPGTGSTFAWKNT